MKKSILLLAVAVLFSVPAFSQSESQNKLSLVFDQSIGIGLGNGPLVFLTSGAALQFSFADYFLVGGGAALRYGLTTDSYNADTGKKNRVFEFDLPIFARAGVHYSIVGLTVDVGYAIGLFNFGVGSLVGGKYLKRFDGFFVEPHLDLSLGSSSVGIGLLLQNGSYDLIQTINSSTDTYPIKKMLPAITLRYSHGF